MRFPRFRNLAIPVVGAFTTVMVTASAAAADDDKFAKYKPAGIGALLPAPKTSYSGPGTLYEQYGSPMLYDLDVQLGWDEFGDWALQFVSVIFMGLAVVFALAAVVVVQWTFKFTSIDKLEDSIATAISGAAGTVSSTLLPSALIVGALIAFANHRRNGSSISQLGWVFATGILSVSLLTTPKVWIEGIDSIRTIGSNTAMEAASAGMGNETKEPIDIGSQPVYGGNQQDNMLRKSADAIWRSYVVTPWCVAEFGNLNTCKEHGKDLLDLPADDKKREEWLKTNVSDGTVGEEAVKYRQGHVGQARVMVTMAAAVCAGLFAILAVALAFASLASLIGALMLLLAGVVFACLWVIPGRPRQWGVRWFDTLLGFTLQSFVSTMVLGCVLVINTASVSMVGSYGWFASAGVSITAAIVAFKFRGIMESIVGVTGATNSSFNAGAMRLAQGAGALAARGAGRGALWSGKKAGAPVARKGKELGGKAVGAAKEAAQEKFGRPFRTAAAARQFSERHANMDAAARPRAPRSGRTTSWARRAGPARRVRSPRPGAPRRPAAPRPCRSAGRAGRATCRAAGRRPRLKRRGAAPGPAARTWPPRRPAAPALPARSAKPRASRPRQAGAGSASAGSAAPRHRAAAVRSGASRRPAGRPPAPPAPRPTAARPVREDARPCGPRARRPSVRWTDE
ncbi:hypothetical protein ACFQ2B_15000 [Streptomyces stramineus]